MKRMLLSLIAAATLCLAATSAWADRVEIVDLPEYAGKWYLTVIFEKKTDGDNYVLAKFIEENQAFRSLLESCVYTPWVEDSRWVQETPWRDFLGGDQAEFPAIILQAPANEKDGRGRVVFFIRGQALLDTLNNLPYLMQESIIEYANKQGWSFEQKCPGGRCPRRPNRPYQPAPEPAKPSIPAPPPVKPLVPTIKIDKPADAPADDPNPIPLVALALIPLAVGGALWQEYRKEQS